MKKVNQPLKWIVLILFFSGVFGLNHPFTQTGSLPTLTIPHSVIPVNGAVDIAINHIRLPIQTQDWIGLYENNVTPGEKPSIWWDYLLNLGVTDTNGSYTFSPDQIPRSQLKRYQAGKLYKLILAYSNSYTVIASVHFSVTERQNPIITSFLPTVVQTRAGIKPQLPEQIIAIESNGGHKKVDVIWNHIAPSQYNHAGSFTIKGVVKGTGRLPKADITVFEGNGPALSFQVISDTHIRNNNVSDVYNLNLTLALKDMNLVNPQSHAMIVVGDITDNGRVSQYDQFNAILQSVPHAKTYFALGNHELFSHSRYRDALNLFKKKTGMSGAYFDIWIKGYHFIILGSEAKSGNKAVISAKQLNWFEQKLADNANSNKPIFVFLHQPLSNTVSGSDRMQDVVQDTPIKSILARFPKTILLTGHTHSVLTDAKQFYQQKYCYMLNTASVAYLWYDPTCSKVGNGGQGLFIDVYPDKVIIKGRDFTRQEWIIQKVIKYLN